MFKKSNLLYSGISRDEKIIISFVIPTYKRADYIRSAINSIILQKNKSNISFEIIVVNNDPSDSMQELIKEYKDNRIRFYSNEENYGQVGNINQGVFLAKGKYVSFLHDDDILLDNYLNEIGKYVLSEKQASCIVVTQYAMFDKYYFDLKHLLIHILTFYKFFYRKRTKTIRFKDCLNSFRDVYNPPTCGILFNREILLTENYFFDVSGAAWDFYNLREFNKKHKVCLIHKPLGIRRMFTGMSNDSKVVEDFKADEEKLVETNQDNRFIKKYGNDLLKQRGFAHRWAKVLAALYFYSNNLDGIRFIPRRLYKMYNK